MHFRNIAILAVFFILSCQQQKKADILSIEKMADIITDIQLLDAAYKLDLLPDDYKSQPQKYYLEILEYHQTDSMIYNKSMQFYAENPMLLKKIYQKVENNIQIQGGKSKPDQQKTSTSQKAP